MADKPKKASDLIKEQHVTYEMYAGMQDDGQRYEIFDGKLELMSPSPLEAHQSVSRELLYIMMQSCRSDYLIYQAPLDVILNEVNVLQPDLIMIHRSRLQIVTKRGIEGPPDLCVEILSPGSHKRDRMWKMNTYAQFGVPEYWIVDPQARTLEQYRLAEGGVYASCILFEGDDAVASDKLPCISFVTADIFKEILHD